MRNVFYKHANIIFGVCGSLLAVSGFIIDEYSPNHLDRVIWSAAIIVSMAGGLGFGTYFKKLHEGVHRDYLTGLWNTRFFNHQMGVEAARCQKNSSDISLLMIDIDNFKQVNDTYGHSCGDKVINQVAGILGQSIRATDTAARIGGEEYAVILPATNLQGAYALAERIRDTVEKASFCCGDASCKITISIGIASVKGKVEIADFLVLADKALYVAKRVKNKVSTFPPILQ